MPKYYSKKLENLGQKYGL